MYFLHFTVFIIGDRGGVQGTCDKGLQCDMPLDSAANSSIKPIPKSLKYFNTGKTPVKPSSNLFKKHALGKAKMRQVDIKLESVWNKVVQMEDFEKGLVSKLNSKHKGIHK